MMRKLKVPALILAILMSLSMVACGSPDNSGGGGTGGGETPNYTYVDLQADDTANITVDGIKNEVVYNEIPAYTFGIRASAKAYFVGTKAGLYAFFDVSDKNMFYNTTTIYSGDCIEFYVEPDNRSSASPRGTTRQIQVTPNGDYAVYGGNLIENWKILSSGNVSTLNSNEYAIKVVANGTPTVVGTDVGVKNDVGYTIEMFLSWEGMGVQARTVESNQYGPSGVVGVAFGHRDVMSYDDTNDNYMNDVANTQPAKYHKLKLVGEFKGVSTPTLASEVTIDGVMNESQWANATVAGATSVTPESGTATINARAFFGANGLYIGVTVTGDTQLYAPISTIGDGVYKNDGCELRIHIYDSTNNQIRGFKLLYDLFGMCWHDSPAGAPGACDELSAIAVSGTINDNSDVDTGWCLELCIPNYELSAEGISNGYLQGNRTPAYAYVMAGVQNYYVTETDNPDDPKAQSPTVAIPTGVTWDSVNTYPRVNK